MGEMWRVDLVCTRSGIELIEAEGKAAVSMTIGDASASVTYRKITLDCFEQKVLLLRYMPSLPVSCNLYVAPVLIILHGPTCLRKLNA